jgi:PKD repeat protein/Na+-transporting methylmalonyl-CoA/oxaloacetate decarboxylase gamma subunit
MGTGYANPEPSMTFSKTIKVVIKDGLPPLANAGPDQTINQHENVTFNGTGSIDNIGIFNWSWRFGYDNKYIDLYGPLTNFTFHTTGEYNVTLKVSDGINWAEDYMLVTVRDITKPIADAGSDITIDQNQDAKFDGRKSTDNVEILAWTWTFEYNNKEVKLHGSQPNFTFEIAGEYNVNLNVTDTSQNWAIDYVMVYVTDITKPIADAGPDKIIDQHETAMFNGTESTDNVGVSNWTWKFDYDSHSVVLFGPTPKFTFHIAGNYNVTLKVFDDYLNHNIDNLMVTVNDITPPIANAGSNITIDQHKQVNFNGKGSTDNVGVMNWTWDFEYMAQKIKLYGPNPSFIFDKVGKYNVTLNVTDLASNWAKDTVQIKVLDITPPVAEAGSNLTVSKDQVVKLDGSSSWDNVGITNWTWEFEYGGKTIQLYGPIAEWNFTTTGNYTIKLIVSDARRNKAIDSIWINITSLADDQDLDDGGKSKTDDDKPTGLGLGMTLLIIFLIILIIIIIGVFFLIFRKGKGGKPDKDEETVQVITTQPVPEQKVLTQPISQPYVYHIPQPQVVIPAIPLQQPQQPQQPIQQPQIYQTAQPQMLPPVTPQLTQPAEPSSIEIPQQPSQLAEEPPRGR